MTTKRQTVFYVVETGLGYLCSDGKETRVLDEAEVYRTAAEAEKAGQDGDIVRKIECVPGKETRLL